MGLAALAATEIHQLITRTKTPAALTADSVSSESIAFRTLKKFNNDASNVVVKAGLQANAFPITATAGIVSEGTTTTPAFKIASGANKVGQLMVSVSETGEAEWDLQVHEGAVVRNDPGAAPVTASVAGGVVLSSGVDGVSVRPAPASITPLVDATTGALRVVSNINGLVGWGFQGQESAGVIANPSPLDINGPANDTLVLQAPSIDFPNTRVWATAGGAHESHWQPLRVDGSANQITALLQLMPVVTGTALLAVTTPSLIVASAVVRLRLSGIKVTETGIVPTQAQLTWQLRLVTTATHVAVEPNAATTQATNSVFNKVSTNITVQGGSTTIAALRGFKVNFAFGPETTTSEFIGNAALEIVYPLPPSDPELGFSLEPVWA